MGTSEVDVLKAQLQILINDFQEHKKLAVKQEQVTELRSDIKYHTIMGAFFVTTAVTVLALLFK